LLLIVQNNTTPVFRAVQFVLPDLVSVARRDYPSPAPGCDEQNPGLKTRHLPTLRCGDLLVFCQ
jgi:hypothetical protein